MFRCHLQKCCGMLVCCAIVVLRHKEEDGSNALGLTWLKKE